MEYAPGGELFNYLAHERRFSENKVGHHGHMYDETLGHIPRDIFGAEWQNRPGPAASHRNIVAGALLLPAAPGWPGVLPHKGVLIVSIQVAFSKCCMLAFRATWMPREAHVLSTTAIRQHASTHQ